MNTVVKITTCASLGLGLAMAQPLAAESGRPERTDRVYRTGSLIPMQAEEIEAKLVRQMLKDMGRCVYSSKPKDSDKLLENSDKNAIDYAGLGFGAEDFHTRFSLNKCLGRAMRDTQMTAKFRFAPQMLRTLMAEEAYLASHKRAMTLPEGSEEFMSTRRFVPSMHMVQSRSFADLADCVVFNAPAEADDVLRSVPTSNQESDAIEMLLPAIPGCLFEGQEITLTPQLVRELAADGLWSRSHYPVPVKAAEPVNAPQLPN